VIKLTFCGLCVVLVEILLNYGHPKETILCHGACERHGVAGRMNIYYHKQIEEGIELSQTGDNLLAFGLFLVYRSLLQTECIFNAGSFNKSKTFIYLKH
jgi:hypothetical protein